MSNPELIHVPRSMWRFLWLFAAIGFLVMLAGDLGAVYLAHVLIDRPETPLLPPGK